MGSPEKPCSGTLGRLTRRLDTFKEVALSATHRLPFLRRSASQGFGGEPILVQPPPITEGLPPENELPLPKYHGCVIVS